MISKIKKGGGFKGVVSYCTEKKDAKIIGGNMAEESKNGITREFSAISSQNYACKKPVFHASLSLPPGQNLTNEQWNDVAKSYLQKIGFADDNQYLVVRHADKEHDHIHIVANRVNPRDLSVVKDSQDFRKTQEACRDLEKKYGLTQIQSGKSKTPQIAQGGKADELRKKIDEALKNSKGDRSRFLSDLKTQGIEVKLNQQSTGRVAGVTFCSDDAKFKGSELGRGYSWQGIQKRLGGQENKAAKATRSGRLAGKVVGRLPGMRVAKTVQKVVVVAKKIAKKIENEM